MSKEHDLAKNTIIILLGKFCTQFLSFFLLPLYTKFLSTEEYGTYDLINTYLILIVPLITLELSDALFRFLIDTRKNNEKRDTVFTSIICGIIAIIIPISIIALLLGLFIKIDYWKCIIIDSIAMTLSNAALQTARGLGDNKSYAIASIITAFFTILISYLFLAYTNIKVEGLLIAIGISNVIAFIYLVLKLKLYKKLKINRFRIDELKSALKYSLPLIPNSIAWWVINVSDRTMITWMLDAGANGVYAVANKFSSAFVSLYTVFNLSWSESASLNINAKDKDSFFDKTINRMLRLFTCMGLGIIAIMPFIFSFFVKENYIEAYNYVPLLVIGSIFNIAVGLISAIYVAKKMSKEIAKTSIFSAIINIVINLFIINWLGVYGACISTIIAFLCMFIYRYISIRKIIKITIDWKFTLSFLTILGFSMFLYYRNNLWGNIINLSIIIIYSLYYNMDFLKDLKKMILKKVRR